MEQVLARLVQECWINDYAVPTGVEEEFDVTEAIVSMGREAALALRDNRDETDTLVPEEMIARLSPGKPICFRVEVEEAIQDYFEGKR